MRENDTRFLVPETPPWKTNQDGSKLQEYSWGNTSDPYPQYNDPPSHGTNNGEHTTKGSIQLRGAYGVPVLRLPGLTQAGTIPVPKLMPWIMNTRFIVGRRRRVAMT